MTTPRYSKRARAIRRPYDKQGLISEMKYIGLYGLKSKHELRVVDKMFHDIKRRAKDILIDPSEEKQITYGRSLLSRLEKQGIIQDIDYTSKKEIIAQVEKVLDMKIEEILDRRLQTKVFTLGLAKSIHDARVMIGHKHIAVNGAIVDKPGFLVMAKSDGHIEISPNSTLMRNRPGRTLKKKKGTADE